jgi:hypothetical protein
MTAGKLAEIMMKSSQDIEKTEEESRRGFKKGSRKNLKLLGD